MPIALDTPVEVNRTVAKYEVTSFAIDVERNEGVVGYDQLDASNVSIGEEKVLVAEGAALSDIITRASVIAGGDVYAAIKIAMLEAVATDNGATGKVE